MNLFLGKVALSELHFCELISIKSLANWKIAGFCRPKQSILTISTLDNYP